MIPLKYFNQLKRPSVLALLTAVLLLVSFVTLVLVYGPIAKVEAVYQYKKFLRDTFQVQDLRSLVMPTINFNLVAAQNPQFGMEIPSLFIDEPIIFNVDPHEPRIYQAALKQGIAHAAGTDLPGYQGLGYYFAHSSLPDLRDQYNAIFYLLGKLQLGDQIFIWHDGQKYEYSVVDKKITAPEDVSFLNTRADRPLIVLQTCWPPGTTRQRMLVFAEAR